MASRCTSTSSAAFAQAVASGTWRNAEVIGGRYGLSSKDFDPAMAKAVFDELDQADAEARVHRRHHRRRLAHEPRRRSGVRHRAARRRACAVLRPRRRRNRWRQQELGEDPRAPRPRRHAQGYFVYDSKKSGLVHDLASALRAEARARAVLAQVGELRRRATSSTSCSSRTCCSRRRPAPPFWSTARTQPKPCGTSCRAGRSSRSSTSSCGCSSIDASRVAFDLGLGSRSNTILQTCFFALSGVLPRDEAIAAIKQETERTYARKGAEIVKKNFAAIDNALVNLREVAVPDAATGTPPSRRWCRTRRPTSCATSSP